MKIRPYTEAILPDGTTEVSLLDGTTMTDAEWYAYCDVVVRRKRAEAKARHEASKATYRASLNK